VTGDEAVPVWALDRAEKILGMPRASSVTRNVAAALRDARQSGREELATEFRGAVSALHDVVARAVQRSR
jgi:hypothetical protein